MKRYMLGLAGVLLLVASGYAQKSALSSGQVQFFDNNGAPLIGGQISTCVAGQTCGVSPANPQASYTTAAGGTPNANPVVLDSAGRASIWLTPGLSYKIEAYTSLGVLLWSQDAVPGGSLVGTSTVAANLVYAGPSSGSAATPTFRALLSADLPGITLGGLTAGTSNNGVVVGNNTGATAFIAFNSNAAYFLNGNKAFSIPQLANLGAGLIPSTSTVNLYEYRDLGPLSICNGTTSSAVPVQALSDTPASNFPAPTCRVGSNSIFASMLYSATSQTIQIQTLLPDDWTSGTGNDVRLFFADVSDTNTGHSEAINVSAACSTPGSTVDPTFNTAQVATAAVRSVAGILNEMTLSTWTSIGCSAGYLLYLKIGLDSSRTATGNMDLDRVEMRIKVQKTAL